MEMFDNVVPVLVLLSGDGEWSKNITSETLAMLQKARVAIQLYGYKDEIEIYEEFVAALENKDLEAVNRNIPRLSFFVQKLREELGYPAKPVTESKC
jgi:hypothetical protein